VLAGNKVLVAGGWNGANALASAEEYDFATGMWSATTSLMGAPRYVHTATRFMVGNVEKILAVGGNSGAGALDTAEVYDSAGGIWSPAMVPMSVKREFHTASLLADGNVLIAGGRNAGETLQSATIYDPIMGSWTDTGPMAFARQNHTASVLDDDRVIVVGGSSAFNNSAPIMSAEVYDPATNGWTDAADLSTARLLHTASVLPSGKVLVTGGSSTTASLNSAEIFDPIQNVWSAVQNMGTARQYHTASVLPGGKVLVAGGLIDAATSAKSAELFLLLPGDACTNAVDCASGFCVDGVCCNTACTGQCEACDGAIPGTCSLVTGAPHPGRPPCEGNDSDCGYCDGTSTACVYPDLAPCATSCAGGSQTVSLCDGKGDCKPFSTPIPCTPYACIDTTGCASSCTVDSECAPGFQCSTEGVCLPGSAKCIDDQTLQNGGESIDCTPYRCNGNACLQTCTSVDDCIAPNVCDAVSKQCIAPGTEGSTHAGCTCSAAGSAGAPSLRWLAATAVAGWLARRRATPSATKRRTVRPGRTER
jgi:hypothetical protein